MGQIIAALFALMLMACCQAHSPLEALENARVLVQGQAELLVLTLMGLGFFSSVLPQCHELNS